MALPMRNKKVKSSPRREKPLTRERIIEASIVLLDKDGERGFTFRSLAEELATGPGAIYWHITDKEELMTVACDAILARTMDVPLPSISPGSTPQEIIRLLALSVFDAIDAHPWLGPALTRTSGQLPMVRIVERLGRQIHALGVPGEEHWATVSALLSYILGVGGQNAANGQLARNQSLKRSDYLEALSILWSGLDSDQYPFVRSLAVKLRDHDDRLDFLAGIDLILKGICSSQRCRDE